jgi:hypothetical protein
MAEKDPAFPYAPAGVSLAGITCQTEGCRRRAQAVIAIEEDGEIRTKKVCTDCGDEMTAAYDWVWVP